MAESDSPRSPFAGLDFSAQHAVRALPCDEIERLLAAHRLYVETGRRQGRRADFGSADLSGVHFAGLNLRRVKMDRAVLRGADLTGAHLDRANLIGAVLEEARLDKADLSRARLSGANLASASIVTGCVTQADMEFALMDTATLRGGRREPADLSWATILPGRSSTAPPALTVPNSLRRETGRWPSAMTRSAAAPLSRTGLLQDRSKSGAMRTVYIRLDHRAVCYEV